MRNPKPSEAAMRRERFGLDRPLESAPPPPLEDIGSRGSLVLAGDRFVATIGLRDVIVIDTPDALLVCAADRSQDVRQIAEEFARGTAGAAGTKSAPGSSVGIPEEGA